MQKNIYYPYVFRIWKHHRYSLLFKSLRLNVKRERESIDIRGFIGYPHAYPQRDRHQGFWFEPRNTFLLLFTWKIGHEDILHGPFLFFLEYSPCRKKFVPEWTHQIRNLGPNANLWPGPSSDGVGLLDVIKKNFQNSNN